MKLINLIFVSLVIAITITLISLSIRGDNGDPIAYQKEKNTKVEGPFETSGSNSRYALTEAIVEENTLFFNNKRAEFSAPDIVFFNGKYFSIFAPGVSFVGIPFYFLGKTVGLPQLVTFLSTTIFAILNTFLIFKIARKLSIGVYTSILSGIIFLFGTNAFTYASTFIQHHLSITLILLALLNAFKRRTFLSNLSLGIIFSAGVLVDIPNIFLMSPIIFYVIFRHFKFETIKEKWKFSLKTNLIGILIGALPFILLFGWYNLKLTGSPFTLGQNIGRSDYPAGQTIQKKQEASKSSQEFRLVNLPFNPRKQLSGFNILLFNNERGLFYYSPVLLFGLLGLILGYRHRNNNKKIRTWFLLIPAIAGINLILYSMFGDPWGGWAFGPRYLLPTAAMLAIGLSLSIEKLKKNPFFIIIFLVLASYSIGVNLMGAITTTQIPPKVEAVALSKPIPYTYKYNWLLINQNNTSSLLYNLILWDKISVKTFGLIYYSMIIALVSSVFAGSLIEKQKK